MFGHKRKILHVPQKFSSNICSFQAQSFVSIGAGTVGALGTAVQLGQISSLKQQVSDKVAATDLAFATTRLAT